MSDTHTTHCKPASDARRNGSGSRHGSDTDPPPSTPCARRSKSDSGTPIRPSSALFARLTNSTPRQRPRPAPISSLASPLGRSMSMRVSKKEKRWSMRLADPKCPVTSTYKDDYQSPEALSLQSLNLETTAEQDNEVDLNASTTYRESYRWQQPHWRANTPRSRSKSDDTDTPNRNGHYTAVPSSRRLDRAANSSGTRTTARHEQASEQHGHMEKEHTISRPVLKSATSTRSSSFFKRNSSSGVFDGQSLSSPDRRKSSASSGEDSVPIKPAAAKSPDVSVTKSPSRNTPSVNGERLQSPASPRPQTLTNGDRGRNVSVPEREDRTPRRMRAYQLQSSIGGSPFAYGSDSGAWV